MVEIPEILKTISGKKITNINDWETFRRPEIKQMFSRFVFGTRPYETEMKGKTSSQVLYRKSNLKNTGAVYQKIMLTYQTDNISYSFPISLFVPENFSEPTPVFVYIMLGGQSNAYNLEENPDIPVLPVPEIIKRGYSIAVIETNNIAPDSIEHYKKGIFNAVNKGIGSMQEDSWATISAWAWGASRVMDYIETNKNLDSDKAIVVGHSRGGKTALWCGALDERFKMVVSNNSGCTGAAVSREKGGEQIENINTNFPYWFCGNYKKYNCNTEWLPVDQHMLLALIAPRLLYVTSSSEDAWACPESEFKASRLASVIYELYGKKGLVAEDEPSINKRYIDGSIAYHIKEGKHSIRSFDWQGFMDFADKHLK